MALIPHEFIYRGDLAALGAFHSQCFVDSLSDGDIVAVYFEAESVSAFTDSWYFGLKVNGVDVLTGTDRPQITALDLEVEKTGLSIPVSFRDRMQPTVDARGGGTVNGPITVIIVVDDGLAPGGGATDLDGLSDVALATPATGETLVFDGANFVNSDTLGDAAAGSAAVWMDEANDAVWIGDINANGNDTNLVIDDANQVITASKKVEVPDQAYGSGWDGDNSVPTKNAVYDKIESLVLGGGSYTDEQAQDAVGAMIADTATIDLTYTDATPELKADVKDSSIGTVKLGGDITAAGKALLDDADAAAQRTTLGLGAMATKADVAESDLNLADNTTANVSTAKHGLAPKAPNDATKYLDGTGAWSVPAGGGGGGASIDVQEFTTTGANTWTKPAGAKMVQVILFGAGGGGGGGSNGTNAAIKAGGSGGGGGARMEKWFRASDLGSTETVTVGAGGSGGNGASASSGAAGSNGVAGGNTSFGSKLIAGGGGRGSSNSGGGSVYGGAGGGGVVAEGSGSYNKAKGADGGTTAITIPGGPVYVSLTPVTGTNLNAGAVSFGNTGGQGGLKQGDNLTPAGSAEWGGGGGSGFINDFNNRGAGNSIHGGGGGGGGGGTTATPAALPIGAGGGTGFMGWGDGGAAGTSSATTPTAGAAGAAGADGKAGSGGGGGGAALANNIAGANGGAGGFPSGAGGGGGAGAGTGAGGNGGAGGHGLAIVITYF